VYGMYRVHAMYRVHMFKVHRAYVHLPYNLHGVQSIAVVRTECCQNVLPITGGGFAEIEVAIAARAEAS
jgi:hypothetical protein